ncbi:MAG TPA: hypothetical protein VLX29_09810 [Nitrospirota bacterium]|nr:hypothetical protein [Nitrospirota bacterium]
MNILPMTVPDTLEGAYVLSIVDFFLSIVIIWAISLVLYLFPFLNKLGNVTDESLKSGH